MSTTRISDLPSVATPTTADAMIANQSSVTSQITAGSLFSAMTGFTASGTGASARTASAKMADIVSGKDFGMVADDAGTFTGTDNGPLLQAAVTALTAGFVFIPPSTNGNGYFFSTGVTLKDNIEIVGDGTLLYNDATITGQGNFLFWLNDCDNVQIRNFRITAKATGSFGSGENPEIAASLEGICTNIVLEDLILTDHQDNAIQYADTDTSAVSSYFNGVFLNRITVAGVAGSAGGGFNFFNRAQSGSDPASTNLYISNVNIDVTGGAAAESSHSPSCIKLNNVDGVYGGNWFLKGGDTACLNVTNGVRNMIASNISTRKASTGLNISTATNVSTTITKDIHINGFTYVPDGVTGGNDDGILLASDNTAVLEGVTINDYTIDGNFTFDTTNDNSASEIKRVTATNGTITGNMTINAPSLSTAGIENLKVSNLTCIGGAGTSAGRLNLNSANMLVNNSQFSNISLVEHDGNGLVLRGSGNIVRDVTSIDGNPDNDATIAAVVMQGDRNMADGIALTGTHNVDYFFLSAVAGKYSLHNFTGTPSTAAGISLTNQTEACVGDIDVTSPNLDLSGSATADNDALIFCATQDHYIASITTLYTEASSSDAGVAINVGNGTSSTRYLTQTSEVSQSLGDSTVYVNNADVTNRVMAAANYLRVATAGGKVGAGEVKVVVSLIKSLD